MILIEKSIMKSIKEQKYEPFDFISEIIRKTDDAIRGKNVLAHCILIYSGINPIMIKLINDSHYYNALNYLSGSYLNIYHAESKLIKNSKYDDRRMMQYLTNVDKLNVYKDYELINDIIYSLNEMHSLDINALNPGMLFFHLDIEKKFIENVFYYELIERNIELLYLEIKKIIKTIRNCICDVAYEYKNNQFEIYNLYIDNLRMQNLKNKIYHIISHPLIDFVLKLKI